MYFPRLIFIGVLFLQGCSSGQSLSQPSWFGAHKNACLQEAAVMTENLVGSGIPAHVLLMRIETSGKKYGHVVSVYTLKNNSVWAWDSYWKSLRIYPKSHLAEDEALAYCEARKLTRYRVLTSEIFN